MPLEVLAPLLAIMSTFRAFGDRQIETRYVDRTDPNLVNQLESLRTSLETEKQKNQTALEEYTSAMTTLKDQNMEQSEKMKDLQKLYDDVAKREAERELEAKLLKDYPLAPFQETGLFQRPLTVHVGIVGRAGIGKSTFVNTLRGLKKSSEGAAAINHVKECTSHPQAYEYEHEDLRVLLWDLPGCGTKKFPTETYLRDMGVRYFNYMILMTDERFMDAEIKLMNEMTMHKVPFAMVRVKIDETQNACEEEGDDFEDAKEEIRSEASAKGIQRIFLISNFLSKVKKYDFQALIRHIKENMKKTLK